MLTIREFAKKINLSPATISLAMKDDDRISDKTLKFVKQKADELGYIPNAMAKAMYAKKTNMIGIVVPDISIFFPPILETIHDKLQESNQHAIVYVSHNQKELEQQLTMKMLEFKIDGIIIASIFDKYSDASHLQKIEQLKIPIVAFNTKPNEFECDFVASDDFSGSLEAVQEFLNLGHRKIAHLAGPQHFAGYRHRLEGYIEAMRRVGATYEEYSEMIKILDEHNEEPSVFKAMDELKQSGMPTAIFCKSDPAAASVMRWAGKNGIKVPDDLSLIGCGNMPMCRWLAPALTSVSAEGPKQGETIVDVLFNRIEKRDSLIKEHLIPVKLVRRESCRQA